MNVELRAPEVVKSLGWTALGWFAPVDGGVAHYFVEIPRYRDVLPGRVRSLCGSMRRHVTYVPAVAGARRCRRCPVRVAVLERGRWET